MAKRVSAVAQAVEICDEVRNAVFYTRLMMEEVNRKVAVTQSVLNSTRAELAWLRQKLGSAYAQQQLGPIRGLIEKLKGGYLGK